MRDDRIQFKLQNKNTSKSINKANKQFQLTQPTKSLHTYIPLFIPHSQLFHPNSLLSL